MSPAVATRGIVAQLASQRGTGQEANGEVATRCVKKPELLDAIAEALGETNARIAGDAAEVMTKVAEQRPDLVVPYAKTLRALLAHRNGRVRWESAHALALVAGQVPRLIAKDLDELGEIALHDKGVIVRDYVLDAIAAYAATGPAAAGKAFPLLSKGLTAWNSKHAARVLRGLEGVAAVAPKLKPDIRALAARFEDHERAGVRKAARSLLKKTA